MMNATKTPNIPALLQASSRLKSLISAVPSRRKPRRMRQRTSYHLDDSRDRRATIACSR
jgi:hypothetical protein